MAGKELSSITSLEFRNYGKKLYQNLILTAVFRIKKFIEKKLKLKVNEEKSKTRKSKEVKFLGMTIIEGTITIAKAAYDKAMEKVRSMIPRGSHLPIEVTV